MKADYCNNPLMPMSYSGMSDKWYEVARSREKRLIKKVDVFMYLSMNHDNAFDLLYVAIDEINRRITKCYHAKFVVRRRKNCLIIRQGLWKRCFQIIAQNEKSTMVALSNKRKSKVWVLSKKLPYDESDFSKLMKSIEDMGVNVNDIELFYD